jgi:asparagine synthase (glutamine-hydrolysing)
MPPMSRVFGGLLPRAGASDRPERLWTNHIMCGFIGGIGQRLDLRRGSPWLDRRGPDSQRVWASADGQVSLLHALLAIVDRDARAHQPLGNQEAGVTVVFVGEIYNYEQLKADLRAYPFVTESDTEVVLAAYVLHGVDGFALLKGMFALAVIDEPQRRLFLLRDAVGKKPLYLARWGKQVLFGSSILPLVAVHEGLPELESDVVSHYWEQAYIPPWRSVFRGVTPVLPGELLELDWEGREVRRVRCEPQAQVLYTGESAGEVSDTVSALLRQAVSRRLHNNPQPTLLLSGGIDSTVVTAVTAALLQGGGATPPQTLTLGAVIPGTQDEGYARYAAHRLGVPLTILRPHRAGRLSERVLRALETQDEPLGMPSYFLLHQLVEAAARHGRVLVTGDGGDEVFLGYGTPADWYGGTPAESAGEPPIRVGPGPTAWMSPWARQVTGSTLVGHMFTKVDRASAEQGVEIRCPLLDWDLLCYARSLPFELLTAGTRTKALLKAQLAGWPRWFLERRKLGFAFNLRWVWFLSRFEQLREQIDPRAVETFARYVPPVFKHPPHTWKNRDILQNFGAAWRLLVWSAFLRRCDNAVAAPQRMPTISLRTVAAV